MLPHHAPKAATARPGDRKIGVKNTTAANFISIATVISENTWKFVVMGPSTRNDVLVHNQAILQHSYLLEYPECIVRSPLPQASNPAILKNTLEDLSMEISEERPKCSSEYGINQFFMDHSGSSQRAGDEDPDCGDENDRDSSE